MKAQHSTIILVLALHATATLAAYGVSYAQPKHEDRQTEVVLVAALHWQHLYTPGYTFAHLRALLRKVQPEVIGVEEPTDWLPPDQALEVSPSEAGVVIPFALEHQIPIFGIDWRGDIPCFWPTDEPDPAETHQRAKQLLPGIRGTAGWYASLSFEETPWGIDSVHARIDQTPPLEALTLDSLREDRIAQNILALANRFPGRRLLIVLGGLHLYTQPARIRQFPNIHLLDARHFLPLSEEEIKGAWLREDIYPLLGAALDSWIVHGYPQTFNHDRTKKLLAALSEQDPGSTIAKYYRARWHLVFGRYEQAASLLDSILASATDERIPFFRTTADWSWPPWSRLQDKVIFTRATLFDLQDHHQKAVALYRKLLSELPREQLTPAERSSRSYFNLATYLESLIREPYQGGPWEAFRILDARRCWQPK